MTVPATILHEAEVELWEAVAYYEDKAPGLGLDFVVEVEHAIQVLQQSPKRWPLRNDGTRRCCMHRFPFVIVYTYVQEQLWVVACAHSKRKPGYWSDRI